MALPSAGIFFSVTLQMKSHSEVSSVFLKALLVPTAGSSPRWPGHGLSSLSSR